MSAISDPFGTPHVVPITKKSAAQKLESSQLSPTALQRAILGQDLDVKKFTLYLASQVKVQDLDERIKDITLSLSMEGASNLSVVVNDQDRALLGSGLLTNRLDVQLDGLWFSLTGCNKSGDEVTLTFEDREIAILRKYTKWKIASRQNMTRAEFVYSMIREVKEMSIPVMIPELHTVQPIQVNDYDTVGSDPIFKKSKGVPKSSSGGTVVSIGKGDEKKAVTITVHGAPIDDNQITVGNAIIATINSMHVTTPRKFKVTAIMAAIEDSQLSTQGAAMTVTKWNPFWRALLAKFDITPNTELINWFNSWAHLEGTAAEWNPLATTYQFPGISWDLVGNSAHVQQYPSQEFGVDATWKTLTNGYYTHIVAAIKTGSPYTYQKQNLAGINSDLNTWSGNGYSGIPQPTKESPSHLDADSRLGPYAMKKGWGSVEDRIDPEAATRMFMNGVPEHGITGAIARMKELSTITYNNLAQGTLNTDHPYARWRTEAENFVDSYGDITGSAAGNNSSVSSLNAGGNYWFWRGKVGNKHNKKVRFPESTWSCVQRLADEVDWRAFFMSGVFFFVSEDTLLRAEPMLVLDEFANGIHSVDGSYYSHRQSATMSITCDVGRWSFPPSSVVLVKDLGPFNGRWLVSQYDRSLFSPTATVTLARERPQLPEPKQGNKSDLQNTWIPGYKGPGTGGGVDGGSSTPGNAGVNTGEGVDADLNTDAIRQELARQLRNSKGWKDYSGGQTEGSQLLRTQMGQKLNGPGVGPVYLDVSVLQFLLWLINDQGFTIGTTALCEDHSAKVARSNRTSAHCLGRAVDIGVINGISIGSGNYSEKGVAITTALDKVIVNMTGSLKPAQLISYGVGGQAVFGLAALSYGGPYDLATQQDHYNHVHVGFS